MKVYTKESYTRLPIVFGLRIYFPAMALKNIVFVIFTLIPYIKTFEIAMGEEVCKTGRRGFYLHMLPVDRPFNIEVSDA